MPVTGSSFSFSSGANVTDHKINAIGPISKIRENAIQFWS